MGLIDVSEVTVPMGVDPIDVLLPRLRGRVFHVSLQSNLDLIVQSGAIKHAAYGELVTTYGNSNGYFRNRGYVSVFDYRTVNDEDLERSIQNCSPAQSAVSGIAIFFLASSVNPRLRSWTDWKLEEAWGEMVVPHVEAGHPGPILAEAIEEVVCVKAEVDPNSIGAQLDRARLKAKGSRK